MATEIAFHKRQYGAKEIKAEKQHLNPGSAPSGPGDLRQAPWVIDTLVSGGKLHWSPGIVLAQTCSRGITELPDAQGKTELSLTFHLQDWAGWTPRFLSPAPRLLRTPHAHKHRHVYFHTTHTPTNTCVHTYRPHTHACTCTNISLGPGAAGGGHGCPFCTRRTSAREEVSSGDPRDHLL